MCHLHRKDDPPADGIDLCELCGHEIIDEQIGGKWGPAKPRLRGLCLTCTDNLGGGKYSAVIIQEERRATSRGTMLCDRPRLPKYIREFFQGFPVENPPQPPQPVGLSVPRKPWRLQDAATGDFVRGDNGQSLAIDTARQAADAATKTAKPDRRPRKARPALPPAAPTIAAACDAPEPPPYIDPPAPAGDWRSNARRLALAAYV